MDRIALDSLCIRRDGLQEPAETLLAYASAYQLTLSTALPRLGVELHSSYLGHPDATQTSAAHLLLAPGRPARQWTVEHEPTELPVRDARRRCLLDPAAMLADQLRTLDATTVATVDIDEHALEQLDHA